MCDKSLQSHLAYAPHVLGFGTSGRRGPVRDLTHLEVYINVLGELQYLLSIPPTAGGIRADDDFYLAYDLRPSSTELVPTEGGRGQLAQAVERAISDAGLRAVNLGRIPTPALAYYALARQKAGIMVTGSHIPFDRNGYKLYTSQGELLKQQEAPINQTVRAVREKVYAGPFSESPFDERGMFRVPHDLSRAVDSARTAYVDRYKTFFRSLDLSGRCIVVYEHSAVGRDILVELLRHLGAEVVSIGRSDTFVPIDTENIDDKQLELVGRLIDEAEIKGREIHAVLSTDGDSDRPLLLGWDPAGHKAIFFPGDLLGMITAEYLDVDAVVVPITCNDGIDAGPLSRVLEPKTKVGSPFVIEGIEHARLKGRTRVCGWEANGGYLVGSDIMRRDALLSSLPTRDAMLPLIAVLANAQERQQSVPDLFSKLPARYSRSALLSNFSRESGNRIVKRFSPFSDAIRSVQFTGSKIEAFDDSGCPMRIGANDETRLGAIRGDLAEVFSDALGFGALTAINYTDGVRLRFSNGDVAHVRPSGNADELRIYATADTRSRAEDICRLSIAGHTGTLRRLEAVAAESR